MKRFYKPLQFLFEKFRPLKGVKLLLEIYGCSKIKNANQILLCKCQTIFRFQSCSRTAKHVVKNRREKIWETSSLSPSSSSLSLLPSFSYWGWNLAGALHSTPVPHFKMCKGMESKHFPRFLKKSPTYSLPGGIREMVPEVWWERFHPGRYNNLAAG